MVEKYLIRRDEAAHAVRAMGYIALVAVSFLVCGGVPRLLGPLGLPVFLAIFWVPLIPTFLALREIYRMARLAFRNIRAEYKGVRHE